jgi:hypothetical protein
VLAGCGEQAAGVDGASGSAVEKCWSSHGLDARGSDGWSARRQRAFLASKGALACAVDESKDQAGLEDVVRPAYEKASTAEVMEGVEAFVADSEGGQLPVSRDAGRLVAAMTDSDDFDPSSSLGLREEIGWFVYRQNAGGTVPAYDQWKSANPQSSDAPETPDLSFIKDLENARIGSDGAAVFDHVERNALEVRRGYESATS